jgi:hypothetical protein
LPTCGAKAITMIRAFVSSTYRDLKDHRAYVIDRLDRSGIFVDPMEKWTAASDEPKLLSQERVRDCQLCILLVGFRRGHIPDGEARSITQMEYAEALRRELKVLVFMASEEADWPADSVDALRADPEMARWRAELKEHKVVGFFTPRPESIELDAAVNRWLQEQVAKPGHGKSAALADGMHRIDIRAYSNSEGVLIVWRTERPIEGCLGFALYREVLGDAGITREVVGNRFSLSRRDGAQPGSLAPSTEQPIQNFRWIDRGQREVRYRVAPVLGTPAKLSEPMEEHTRSAWTPWVSPRTGENPGCRAFFSSPIGAQNALGKFRSDGGQQMVREQRQQGRELRSHLGGGLRQRILELLAAAELGDRRVYAALAELDDPELRSALERLGDKLHLILAPPPIRTGRRTGTRLDGMRKLCKELRAASVHVYQQGKAAGAALSNFVVSCDRWGTPLSVLTGCAAWTTSALCLQSNNGIYLESVPLARAYLDRWHNLLDAPTAHTASRARTGSVPAHIREGGMSITVWNTPTREKAELRDVSRLIRGARQGVLFLVDGRRVARSVMDEVIGLSRDDDLFIEGLSWSDRGRSGGHTLYEYHLNTQRRVLSQGISGATINSTVVLVDPFGPHPVVMTGSHNLSSETSSKNDSDLLVIENMPSLAAEYAVHLIGMFDRFRFRAVLAASRDHRKFIGLMPNDAWQERYFQGHKRAEFNFLFGSLSPGL